ncbi:MAG: hypothetical protein ACK5ML_08020 [Lachnospiraceae bacterium]
MKKMVSLLCATTILLTSCGVQQTDDSQTTQQINDSQTVQQTDDTQAQVENKNFDISITEEEKLNSTFNLNYS